MKGELTIADNLLLYCDCIMIPKDVLQMEILHKIHQDIVKCHHRVSPAVWLPGISKQIKEIVKACLICLNATIPPKEPLLQTPFPAYLLEKIPADLCYIKGSTSARIKLVHYRLRQLKHDLFFQLHELQYILNPSHLTLLKDYCDKVKENTNKCKERQ